MRSEGRTFSSISSRSTLPAPDETDEAWRLWIAGRWKRARFVAGRQDVDVVFHESTWWSNGHGRSRTNGGARNSRHGEGPGADLVRTPDYPTLIDIGNVTSGSRLGRPTLDVEARIRRGTERRRGRGLHGLVIGEADEIVLAIDRERGVLLRAESWFRGSAYRVLEMTDVAFDEEFRPSTFEIRPLPGLEWQETPPGTGPR